jgi:hypothetical protein
LRKEADLEEGNKLRGRKKEGGKAGRRDVKERH